MSREEGTNRTLLLNYPNRYIPQFMEDLTDIPLVLHFGETKKTLPIEVANIKSYTLRVKLKNGVDLSAYDFDKVTAATIDAKNPVFLLEELKKKLYSLDYSTSFDMQKNLCENIEFVFGPPGTGKTTYLASNVILPLIRNTEECKVLVLTPTNKAADVLVKRIMECSEKDTSYFEWLIRFGTTGDELIEESPVYKEKTFDIRSISKNVTVTTIARFSYDYFMPEGERLYLDAINWDYIIIDESSMIPLVYMIYPLYKKTPKEFIIAGDPFQIEPITAVDLWKNENIYTMVNLLSFTNPETVPYKYKVHLLTTQYRSIPTVGSIFSNFAYGGILKHFRSEQTQRKLNTDSGIKIETLNILKYPVSKYESVYKAKRLQRSSSFHIYSALFTYEYVCNLARDIARNNPDELFKIGVIAPYRAQADIIDKLVSSESLPKEVDIQVGTIHGFQGDECDIIFAVLNTPPTISNGKEMFLNKLNIINVSISRARDYLFIVMPDDNTEGISNLRLVKRVEALIKKSSRWIEYQTPDLERELFDDKQYIENNAFSTSHHSVNVYGLPERKYEIRADDDAVDIQVHKALHVNQMPSINQPETRKDENSIDELRIQNGMTDNESILSDEQMVERKPSNSVLMTLQSVNQQATSVAVNASKSDQLKGFDVHVTGEYCGKYWLIPYVGKLKKLTSESPELMYIAQVRDNKRKLLPVSAIVKDKLIYMPKESFIAYKKSLLNKSFEMVKTVKNSITENHLTPGQAAKELAIDKEMLLSWYADDPLISSANQLVGTTVIPYFSRSDIENLRKKNIQGIKDNMGILTSFEEYINKNALTFSYKLVFMLAMLKLADSNGIVKFDDLVHDYRLFYINRINKGLPVDKPGCVYTRRFLENDKSIKQSILTNPLEKFERRGFIFYKSEKNEIIFNPILWSAMTNQKKDEIKKKEQQFLTEYYRRIDGK